MDIKLNPVAGDVASRFSSATYRLLEKIGEGGFGQVYKAIQINTGQPVAIKILRLNPEFDADRKQRYMDRFERETLLGSRLQHPNIVRLLDKGQCDADLLYAVFEFVDGQTLKDRLQTAGPLEPVQAGEIMTQVLDALCHTHAQGIIHRDIKPANIILVDTGAKLHAKVLDFGIGALVKEARRLDDKSITLTQETLGTPSYSSPEQLRGEPPTPGSDLYVWGLVFIECLTGRPAISGSNLASVFHKQLNQEPVPLPTAIAGHPLAILLRRVLAKKARERSTDALALFQELSQINLAALLMDRPVAPLDPYTPADATTTGVNAGNAQTLVNNRNNLYTGLTERKQITVLCLRIEARATAEGIDHEVINALHRDQKAQCCDIAALYGALHVGALGDTLLFYFGYPTVSDNDSRLCARTALDIISGLNKRNALLKALQGIVVEACGGMHTGFITCYADVTPEGDTPNIAMALARVAEPNQILCSESSKAVLDSYIKFEPAGSYELGVEARRIATYLLTGERHVEAFGFLRANRRHHSFVGREQELAQLISLLDGGTGEEESGPGFAHVHGEAGIGKSRLVFELRNRAQGHQHLVAQCLPEYQYNALYPVLTALRYQCSLDALPPPAAVERLQQRLALSDDVDQREAIPLLCTWLNLPLPESCPPVTQPADRQKQILFQALNALFIQGNRDEHGSTLFIVEDLHWADPVSIDFIAQLLAQPAYRRVGHICISTSRQALPAALEPLSALTLELPRLNQDLSKAFIIDLFDRQQVADKLLTVIASRTDGIPLFIEELVIMLKQRQLVRRLNGIIDFSSPEGVREVPNSLRDSLQQKLDELHQAKETAQLAAAIGREFDYDLLAAASPQSEAQLQTDLGELVKTELVFLQRKVGGDSYIFKHALIRDAAYESMTSLHRTNTHRHIAQALERAQTDNNPQNPGLLARHWSEAGDYDKAVDYGGRAAKAALRRSSADEAISHGQTVQAWIDKLDADKQLDAKLAIFALLTSAFMESKGWGSKEVLFYSEESLKLLKSGQRHDELVSHLWWKMLNGIVGGRRDGLAAISAEMEIQLPYVSHINQSAIRCAQGFYHFTEGNRPACIEAFTASIRLYDPKADKAHQQVYGFDVGVFAKAALARAYADTCQQAKALNYAKLAVDEAKTYEHVPSIGISLMYYGLVHQQYKHQREVEQSAAELIGIAEKYHLPIYKGFGRMLHDWATDNDAEADAILAELKQAGSRHGLGHFQSFYAELYAQHGQYERAIEKLDECLALDGAINEPNYQAYLLLKRARCGLANGDHERALEDLDKAHAMAKTQGISYITQQVASMKDELLVTT